MGVYIPYCTGLFTNTSNVDCTETYSQEKTYRQVQIYGNPMGNCIDSTNKNVLYIYCINNLYLNGEIVMSTYHSHLTYSAIFLV